MTFYFFFESFKLLTRAVRMTHVSLFCYVKLKHLYEWQCGIGADRCKRRSFYLSWLLIYSVNLKVLGAVSLELFIKNQLTALWHWPFTSGPKNNGGASDHHTNHPVKFKCLGAAIFELLIGNQIQTASTCILSLWPMPLKIYRGHIEQFYEILKSSVQLFSSY